MTDVMQQQAPPEAQAQEQTQPKQEKMRSIGRWYIGETLGKGGYSWYAIIL